MEGLELAEDGGADIGHELQAVCARHPERRASIVCPYCGSFACSECTLDTLWGESMCEPCNAHGRAQYPLPWEESLSPVAFVHSAYLIFADTKSVFGAFPDGRVRRALLYALQVGVLGGVLSTVTRWLFASSYWADDTPGLPRQLLETLLRLPAWLCVLLLAAAGLYGAALLFGGRPRFAQCARALAYASTLSLLDTLGGMLERVLSLGSLHFLLDLLALFFFVWALSSFAQGRAALPRGRAVAAAFAPLVVLIVFATGLLAITSVVRHHHLH